MRTLKILFLTLFLLPAFFSNAQSSMNSNELGWSWRDSSIIPASGKAQFVRFMSNDYPYPPKPRNMWELGLGAGVSYVAGDVRANAGFGGTISLRKALDHMWSIRASLTGMLNSGGPSVYGASIGQVAYKNQTHQFSIDGIMSLNSSSNYRGDPKTNVYLLGGYSLLAARVLFKTPLAGPSGGAQPGGYSIFYGINNPNSQSGLVGTMGGAVINDRHAYSVFHGFDLGGGIAFKVSPRLNIGIEHKFTFTFPGYDYLDAFKGGNNDDYYGFTSVRFNINLGNRATRVYPLWWYNANDYIYSEVNEPKHMKLPKVVLPDADGDGITDQFDLEPNTPRGCPVDSHGVSRDTDGDGVPDCRDKEVLTPRNCFPVNNDGVGTCPEPACCKELRDMLAVRPVTPPVPTCTMGNLPSVQFKGNAKLSRSAEATLAAAAATIRANPNCKVKVLGYGASSKAAQQSSWERVNAVIKYLVERQGIAESRLIFSYGMDGDSNTVDLQSTTEDGPSAVPAPHPNLKG